jgi:Domain of unknown function (DUF4823)
MAKGIFLSPFAAVLLAGCASTYDVQRQSSAASALRREAAAYVAVPPDCRFGAHPNTGSGLTTAQAVAGVFGRFLQRVEIGRETENYEQALALARAGGYMYLILPQLFQWEDHPTEWSGIRDKINIIIQVIDVPAGEVVASTEFTGKSKWATFGGNHPQDLIIEPLRHFADSLFGAASQVRKGE